MSSHPGVFKIFNSSMKSVLLTDTHSFVLSSSVHIENVYSFQPKFTESMAAFLISPRYRLSALFFYFCLAFSMVTAAFISFQRISGIIV